MTSKEMLQLQTELATINKTLAKTLGDARKSASQYEHHLVQNSSARAYERLTYLLAQAHAVASQADLSLQESEQILGQLDTLQAACSSKEPRLKPAQFHNIRS